eukprot:494677-Prorocentrum_minimum.AAC.1
MYCTTHLEGNLDTLGGSLYLCTARRPLFYASNSELGTYGVSSDHPMYNTTRLEDASAILHSTVSVPRLARLTTLDRY